MTGEHGCGATAIRTMCHGNFPIWQLGIRIQLGNFGVVPVGDFASKDTNIDFSGEL
jgi:hypothetical protein